MARDDNETVRLRRTTLSRLGVFFKDFESGDAFASSHWKGLGYDVPEMQDQQWVERVHPEDRNRVTEAVDAHFRGDSEQFYGEYRVRSADGTYHWFVSTGVVETRDKNGNPVEYVGHDEDVTGLHILREELEAAKRIAEERAAEAEALRGAGAVVVATLDAPTAVRSLIQQLKTLVPFDTALVCELDNRELRLVGGSSDITERTWRAFAKRLIKPILTIIKSRIPELVQNDETDAPYHLMVPLVVRGATVGIMVASRTGIEFTGEDVRIAMSMADYLALALSNARLFSRMQQRAEIDQLSGVLTRRAYMESAEQVIDQSFHSRHPVCCIILDIDHFKSINDTFGHPVGDQVLRMLGSVLRDSLRSTDLVGRYGGEEFCALLPQTDREKGLEVAERLRADISRTEFGGVNRPVTASIGLSHLVHTGKKEQRLSIEQMISRADIALFQAKSAGRNRVIGYEPGMTEE